MKSIIFVDSHYRESFHPLTLTKPFSALRIGIQTFEERWQSFLGAKLGGYITDEYLQEKYSLPEKSQSHFFIDARFFPTDTLIESILSLREGEALYIEENLVCFCGDFQAFVKKIFTRKEYVKDVLKINHMWDLFTNNDYAITEDFKRITKERRSQPISSTNGVLGSDIFIEKGAVVEFSNLNSSNGPIYIGKNAEVMEGCNVRGAFALCDNSVLKMGAKIYGATTIGPFSKVGGEVSNSIIQGFSNKGHDGFLGNSVIGEWCNLGAGTENSNLKNNYKQVSIYNYKTRDQEKTGLTFCGLFMGDHSKSAIGSIFNTGTVVGVSANIFNNGFLDKFIPSFTWGNPGNDKFNFDKAIEVASVVMKRRNQKLTHIDSKILAHIHKESKS